MEKKKNVWLNWSSLAVGVLLEVSGSLIKNACWLCPVNDVQHINMVELDAMLKGIKLTLEWETDVFYLKINSLLVYPWISDTLISKGRLKIKATIEMLIRTRNTLSAQMKKYNFFIDILLVNTKQNLTSKTKVPEKWLSTVLLL